MIYIVGLQKFLWCEDSRKERGDLSSSLTHPDWSKLVRGDHGIPGPAGAPGPRGTPVRDSAVNITILPSYSVCPMQAARKVLKV